jgi:ubiquinone/menaquinone biosynthesis C-methylase UbiE
MRWMLTIYQGEIVIDLGSGAGLDVFLASKKVGATGRAIGVDMNDVYHKLNLRCYQYRLTTI